MRATACAVALVIVQVNCGGRLATDGNTGAGYDALDGGDRIRAPDGAPGEDGHAAIALPMGDKLFLIVGHAQEGRKCTSPDTQNHCGHWSVVIEALRCPGDWKIGR